MMAVLTPLLLILVFLYFRFFFARAFKSAGVYRNTVAFYIANTALALAFGTVLGAPLGLGGIFSLHVMAAAVFVRLINYAVTGGKNVKRALFANSGFATDRAGGDTPAATKRKRARSVWDRIYNSGAVPVAVAVVFVVGGLIHMNTVVETRFAVQTDKNIRGQGYTIALIADVHFGVSVGEKEFNRICDEISALDADIVALCGDIVDENTSKAGMNAVFAALGGIKSRFGTYYVYGNHDRQVYTDTPSFTDAELASTIVENGITVLRDEAVRINDELVLVGREDASRGADGGRKSVKDILSGVGEINNDTYVITLDHQPRDYVENAAAGVDLVLSGHTHGGQVFPMNFVFDITGVNDAIYGIKEINGTGSKGIVTSGVAGWGFPIKTCAPAEYAVIDITPAI